MTKNPSPGENKQVSGKPNKARRIILRLTARQREDNTETIKEIREALKEASNCTLYISTVAEPPVASEQEGPARNIALELKIGNSARLHLDLKDSTSEVLSQPDVVKAREIKRSLWKWFRERATMGVTVIVRAALDWLVKRESG